MLHISQFILKLQIFPLKHSFFEGQSLPFLKITKQHSNQLQLNYIMKGCCQSETRAFAGKFQQPKSTIHQKRLREKIV